MIVNSRDAPDTDFAVYPTGGYTINLKAGKRISGRIFN
jgi:hypothetical protein